ncbi:MAG: NCS2 family permease, partial [Romboutsia sp.]|nr:NCS2 family permease [Romboutsia sp.]
MKNVLRQENNIYLAENNEINLRKKKNIKTEVLAGCTTFVASVYIILTNALILSDAGISSDAAMMATIFTCVLSTILMGVLSDTPFVVVPGMGINSLFTYTIVHSMGLSWQEALGAVFVSGIIFTIIACTNLTKVLLKSIPNTLKHAITVGVGFFILFIGLQKSGLVVPSEATMVSLGNIASKESIVTLLTLILILVLHIKNINGGLLISMIAGTIISLFMGIIDLSTLSFTSFNIGAIKEVFLAMSLKNIFTIPFIVAVFSITIVIVFENMGILYGQMEAIGKIEQFEKPFKVAGISNIIAGVFGTSPTIVAAENFSGISQGGKGKIAAFTSAILFLLSIFLIPVLKLIPNGVISSVLIFVGILMIQTFFDIEKGDMIDSIGMIIIIVMIPFTYNIVNGISLGFISYTVLKVLTGKYKDVSPSLYV